MAVIIFDVQVNHGSDVAGKFRKNKLKNKMQKVKAKRKRRTECEKKARLENKHISNASLQLQILCRYGGIFTNFSLSEFQCGIFGFCL